jgi:hypothetical protein
VKKAAEILARLLERQPGAGAQPSGSLFGEWQEIVGLSLAEHCRAVDIRHHSLLVEADHPGWMQLLQLSRRTVLAKIRQRFPELEIRDLKVRVVAAPSGRPAQGASPPPQAAGAPGAPGAPGAAASPEVEEAVAAVADGALKEQLRQLLAELERRNAQKPPGV